MEKIIESMQPCRDTELPEIYVFICLLVNEEMIFFNFFENLFIETFVKIKRKKDEESKKTIEKLIFVVVRICRLIS